MQLPNIFPLVLISLIFLQIIILFRKEYFIKRIINK